MRGGQDAPEQSPGSRRFDKGTLDAIRQRITLSNIIGRTVRLKKAGKGEWSGLCPVHQENTPSFTVNDDKGFAHCFGCGAHFDVIDWVQHQHGVSFVDAVKMLEQDAGLAGLNAEARAKDEARRAKRDAEQAAEAERKAKMARGLWLHAMPGPDTPAEAYLRGRGIDFAKLGMVPRAVRYRGDVPHGKLGQKLPAMLLPVIGPDRKQIATHRTYLMHGPKGWTKIAQGDAKMVLGSFVGGHIPLWKGAQHCPLWAIAPQTPVYVSEGIEDGLTVACMDPSKRVVAGVTLGGIGRLILPPQAGNMIIIGQNDGDGRGMNGDGMERAIAEQQRRAREDGSNRLIQAIWPPPEYKDFNDMIMNKKKEGAA